MTTAAAAASAEAGEFSNPPPCDVLVYFVWTGDDKNGKALQSSAFRFSAFPEQELQNRLKDSLPGKSDLFVRAVAFLRGKWKQVIKMFCAVTHNYQMH